MYYLNFNMLSFDKIYMIVEYLKEIASFYVV